MPGSAGIQVQVWVPLAISPAITPKGLGHGRKRLKRTETGVPGTLDFQLGTYLRLRQDNHLHQVHSELSP